MRLVGVDYLSIAVFADLRGSHEEMLSKVRASLEISTLQFWAALSFKVIAGLGLNHNPNPETVIISSGIVG